MIEATHNLFKLRIIKNVGNICKKILNVTRQYFYKKAKQKLKQNGDLQVILALIKDIHKEHPSYGCIKIYKELTKALDGFNISIGRDKAIALIKSNKMSVGKLRKHHYFQPSIVHLENDNLLFKTQINRVNQVWLSDITFVPLKNNHLVRVAFVMDYWSRKILNFEIGNHSDLVKNCLSKSLFLYGKPEVFHSDRGIEFKAKKVVEQLKMNNIKISLSRKATPTDNGIMERTIGIVKNELKIAYSSINYDELKQNLTCVVNYFNNSRMHMSLNFKTPLSVFNGEQ